jgi:hypothetical protein
MTKTCRSSAAARMYRDVPTWAARFPSAAHAPFSRASRRAPRRTADPPRRARGHAVTLLPRGSQTSFRVPLPAAVPTQERARASHTSSCGGGTCAPVWWPSSTGCVVVPASPAAGASLKLRSSIPSHTAVLHHGDRQMKLATQIETTAGKK